MIYRKKGKRCPINHPINYKEFEDCTNGNVNNSVCYSKCKKITSLETCQMGKYKCRDGNWKKILNTICKNSCYKTILNTKKRLEKKVIHK